MRRRDDATVDWIDAMATDGGVPEAEADRGAGAPAEPLDAPALLAELQRWAAQGWLRPLEAAFARFLHTLEPQASPALLLGGALVAHMEGRGHGCLPLDALHAAPHDWLAWGAQPRAALQALWPSLPATLDGWLQALRDSALVCGPGDALDEAPCDTAPLMLDGTRLYLRRYWHYEQRVARQLRARGTTAATVDPDALRPVLARLFPPPASDDAEPDWQQVACALALRSPLAVITGGPGTGKTYTVARLLAALLATHAQPQQLRVALAAPTGKAAARLKQSIEDSLAQLAQRLPELPLAEWTGRIGAARTLHGLLGARPGTRRFGFDAANPLDVDVLVVDEASMVHLEMVDALLDALPAAARLVLLGDKDQLASVEAGAVLGDLCGDAEAGHYDAATCDFVQRACGVALPEALRGDGGALAQQTVMLRRSHRFGGPIGALARAVNQGDAAAAERVLRGPARPGQDAAAPGAEVAWLEAVSPAAVVRLALQGRPGAPGGFRGYLSLLRERPAEEALFEDWVREVLRAFERFRVLCAVREGEWGVAGLNAAIEAALVREGLLPRRDGEWYEGRPVMVTRNQPALGVFNGDIGIALKGAGRGAAQRVWFLEGPALRSVLASRLPEVQTAFALTVHKSQGSEFEHTVLALPEQGSGQLLTRELAYTGITRAKRFFTLVTPQPAVLAAALAHRTRRASGLPQALAAPLSPASTASG